MEESGVSKETMREAILGMNTKRILPFRFIAAARYAKHFEPELEKAMFKNTSELPKLKGKTIVLVDVSGSMDHPMSGKSDMTRIDAACGVGMVCREVCEEVEIYSFSDYTKEIPPRHGFALRDAIMHSQSHSGTDLGAAVTHANQRGYDRLIVITDEQSCTPVSDPVGTGYMVNVAANQNGVGYGKWTHLDGFSESIINFIIELEKL
jgi:60 kDa SS-A/Ro ribonucleoprotein